MKERRRKMRDYFYICFIYCMYFYICILYVPKSPKQNQYTHWCIFLSFIFVNHLIFKYFFKSIHYCILHISISFSKLFHKLTLTDIHLCFAFVLIFVFVNMQIPLISKLLTYTFYKFKFKFYLSRLQSYTVQCTVKCLMYLFRLIHTTENKTIVQKSD